MASPLNDRESFQSIYTQYFSVLVNYAFTRTRDLDLSQEVVQQCFVRLWSRRQSIEIRTSLKSYLFTMVRHAIIDHFRQNNKYAELPEFPPEIADERGETGFSEADVLLIRHVVQKTLEEMKPKRKLIFELSKFEGLTYAEIASHLGISERAVEDNMAKALQQLKEKLIKIKKDIL
jgi:RNA polymerase sigma-70 factor (ECF subfamily)